MPSARPLPSGRQAFRPDIQALRAVAVAGVVVFHVWPWALPGGFVGVDVFFVISGFLITQQLLDESLTSGRVALGQFWSRRIRRILPAAFTVLLACLAVLVAAMPRVTWHDNLADLRAAAAYAVNWQLAARSVDYLGAENAPSLVQHYWSLAVEEQFYIVWPLLLAGVTAMAVVARRRIRAMTVAIAVVAAASFVTSLVWTSVDAPVAFFATPTRAWEFAAGGLAAVVVRRSAGQHTAARTTARAAAAWVGLVLIGCGLTLISPADAFPGWRAAVPVLGAALVLAADAGDTVGWSPSRLLRLRPLQRTGDNSYSIYLWHWPLLISMPFLVHRSVHALDRIGIVAATLLLAALTKVAIEDPIRTRASWRARLAPNYAFAAAVMTVVVVVASLVNTDVQRSERQRVVAERARAGSQAVLLVRAPHARSCFGAAAMDPANGCRAPFARTRSVDPSFAATDGPGDPCLQNLDASTPVPCVLGDAHASRTIALVGNSHAWRLSPALGLYGQQHHWRVVVFSRINCLGLTTTVTGANGASANCLLWSARVQQQLLTMPHLSGVVFASYRYTDQFTDGVHPTPFGRAALTRQVLALWTQLNARHRRVLVAEDVPGMRPTADPTCVAQTSKSYDPCTTRRSTVVVPNPLTDLAQQNPQLATYLPLDSYFCDATRCHGVIGGVIVYFDSHHITTTFSRSLARYLGDEIQHALASG